MEKKNLALCVVKAVTGFLLEMEGSKTLPNTVNMNREQYEAVMSQFPYLIQDDFYIDGNNKLRILISESEVVAVGFSYYTDDVLMYR
jgi:hypothetical protein